VPLTTTQLVRLATIDLSDPANVAAAQEWLDGLHRLEYELRDILGRVLQAAQRAAAREAPHPGARLEPLPTPDGYEPPGCSEAQPCELRSATALKFTRPKKR